MMKGFLLIYFICVIIGLAASFAGSLVGMGGGVILIPAMLLMYQYSDAFAWATPQVIVGISLITMVFTAFSSTLAFYRSKRIHIKIGLLFLTGSIPGGILGSWLNQFISSEDFSLYFGVLMIVMSFLFLVKRDKRTDDNVSRKTPVLSVFIISLIIGAISGLFGTGGGAMIVPAMIFLFGLSVHTAAATSMFVILFISIMSAGTHIALGHIVWEYAGFFVIGAWVGGTLGAKVNQLMKSSLLEWILRLMLVIVGIRLIIEGFM
ncbi:sulfite exporter TauE/SafE family protein [Lentibacillus salicampi]|uniref:Probable membrane transporter protein n=1 Tax=Lentibacillus salicampi TaxID=175306 RepID=A0A4Y9A788_9BACI|nr:sulfite exporter TauE/SafE family protein [Lentibacillus salicampi]TFJ91608.1 sulfite exporter TauE/SafE family protein [Lentibacillus salicampi]